MESRLLIIEDNTSIRTMLARSLELKGLEVSTAENGKTGLKLLKDHRPDIAVVDIGLPDINGYDVSRTIRDSPEHDDMLLVAVTGYGREEEKAKASAAGFDAHLVKPVDPSELITSLAKLRQQRFTSSPE